MVENLLEQDDNNSIHNNQYHIHNRLKSHRVPLSSTWPGKKKTNKTLEETNNFGMEKEREN